MVVGFEIWLPLAAVCLLGAMSPGPSLAMIVRHTLSGRRKEGLTAAWSHATGIAIYATLTVLGLAVLLTKAHLVFTVISLLGACYLIGLGTQALFSRGGALDLQQGAAVGSVWHAARDGFAISLLNPKILLFFIALFSPFVAREHVISHHVLVMTPWFIDGLWYSVVVMLLSQASILQWMRRHSRWIDRITGCILLGIGLVVIVEEWLNF
ncbi:LysE family translocator [Celerinatantimonas sp. YJH-8]|uniref:LysE family translocator n=1 Tax=Celerinatantimonas sp. YJH-8 TaxID=3228714 RepID=UPI0038C86186